MYIKYFEKGITSRRSEKYNDLGTHSKENSGTQCDKYKKVSI